MDVALSMLVFAGLACRIVAAFAVYYVSSWLLTQSMRTRSRHGARTLGPRARTAVSVACALTLVI